MGLTGFDKCWKTTWQPVIVGSTLKADKPINATDEVAEAMKGVDAFLASVLSEADVLV